MMSSKKVWEMGEKEERTASLPAGPHLVESNVAHVLVHD
jgi:hypothetical protein